MIDIFGESAILLTFYWIFGRHVEKIFGRKFCSGRFGFPEVRKNIYEMKLVIYWSIKSRCNIRRPNIHRWRRLVLLKISAIFSITTGTWLVFDFDSNPATYKSQLIPVLTVYLEFSWGSQLDQRTSRSLDSNKWCNLNNHQTLDSQDNPNYPTLNKNWKYLQITNKSQ